MTDISEDEEHREVWFIFSPLDQPWANLRIATFTKARDVPHHDLVVIHNEAAPERIGVRIWDAIVENEYWIKVRKIEVPTTAEVMTAWRAQRDKR